MCRRPCGGWPHGPCDFSVSPSPFGLDFGTLDFGTSDLGLTIGLNIPSPVRITPLILHKWVFIFSGDKINITDIVRPIFWFNSSSFITLRTPSL